MKNIFSVFWGHLFFVINLNRVKKKEFSFIQFQFNLIFKEKNNILFAIKKNSIWELNWLKLEETIEQQKNLDFLQFN